MLALDSSLDELIGAQGTWLTNELDHIPADVDFVFIVFHHPPYTSSSAGMFGEGHSARVTEQRLARMLEDRQAHVRAGFVVFSGHVHNYERHAHSGVTYLLQAEPAPMPIRLNGQRTILPEQGDQLSLFAG